MSELDNDQLIISLKKLLYERGKELNGKDKRIAELEKEIKVYSDIFTDATKVHVQLSDWYGLKSRLSAALKKVDELEEINRSHADTEKVLCQKWEEASNALSSARELVEKMKKLLEWWADDTQILDQPELGGTDDVIDMAEQWLEENK